jgi:hypothetical protein
LLASDRTGCRSSLAGNRESSQAGACRQLPDAALFRGLISTLIRHSS